MARQAQPIMVFRRTEDGALDELDTDKPISTYAEFRAFVVKNGMVGQELIPLRAAGEPLTLRRVEKFRAE